MNTLTILNKRISFCPNIRTKSYQPITLFDALNSIRTNVYGEQIKNIRRLLHNGNFQSYKSKKKQLPSYIFSGIAYGDRHKFDISGYTSLMVVDIDKLENLELTKTQLKLDQHIICVWTSPSGKGLKALFYLDYKTPINENIWIIHEHCAFPQIDNYLLSQYGIRIDKGGADITRLCFVSSDSEIHLKKEFEPFPVYITLDKKQIWKFRTKYYYGNKSVRKAILNEKRISKLTNNKEANR